MSKLAAYRSTIAVKVVAALLFAALVVAVYLSPARSYLTVENVREIRDAARVAWYAPPLFILAYAVGCTFLIPATLFIIAAGATWGWALGSLYALTGAVLGSLLSYAIARFLGGGVIARFGAMGMKLSARLEHVGFSAFLMLRLVPLFPFAMLNYGAGVAKIRVKTFALATLIGVAPSHIVAAYSADALLAGTITREQAFQRIIVVVVLMMVVMGVPMLFRKRAQRSLHLEEAPDA